MKNRLYLAAGIAILVFGVILLAMTQLGKRPQRQAPSGSSPAEEPAAEKTPAAPSKARPIEAKPFRDVKAAAKPAPEVAPRPDLPGAISGRVLAQESSAPLEGFTVRVAVESGPAGPEGTVWLQSATTGSNGEFAFQGLEYAPHRLRALGPGRLVAEEAGVFPGDPVEVRMERQDDIPCVLVLDGEGGTAPLPRKKVELSLESPETTWALEAESDAGGAFGISGIRREDFESARKRNQIEVLVPGYAAATLSAQPGGESYRVSVEEGVTVVGHVREGATKKPIAGAKVCSDSGHEVAADERGAFRISGVEDDVTAYAPGYVPVTKEVDDADDGDTIQVELLLDGGLSLRGKVKDAAGAPIAGVKVTVAADAWDLSAGADALPARLKEAFASVSDEQGDYRIDGLSSEVLDLPGDLELEVRPPGATAGFTHEVEVEEEAGEVVKDIVLDLQGTLAGRVQEAGGEAVAKAGVFLESIDSDSLIVAGTDAAGEFVLRNVLRGSYHVRVEKDGQLLHLQDVQLPLPRLDVTLSGMSRAEGVVHAQDTREALAGMSVSLFAAGVNRVQVASGVLTDSSGRFKIEAVPPGTYSLLLSPGPTESPFSRLGVRHEAPLTIAPEGWRGDLAYPILPGGEVKLTFQLASRTGEVSPVTGSVWVAVTLFRPAEGVLLSATRSEPALVQDPQQGFQARWRAGEYRLRCTSSHEGRMLAKDEVVILGPGAVVERAVSFPR